MSFNNWMYSLTNNKDKTLVKNVHDAKKMLQSTYEQGDDNDANDDYFLDEETQVQKGPTPGPTPWPKGPTPWPKGPTPWPKGPVTRSLINTLSIPEGSYSGASEDHLPISEPDQLMGLLATIKQNK
jgi:hypothetical protein